MSNELQYAFIDESGSIGPSTSRHFLIVAAIIAGRARNIELTVRRALKKYGTSLASGEMKADSSKHETIRKLLLAIAVEDVSIISVIVDRQSILNWPRDSEEIYRQAVARAVYDLVLRWPRIEICLDKRYTKEQLRYELERYIREKISDLPQKMVLIRQEDSITRKELQAADFVAWAFYQKYERGDHRFYDLIASRVIQEEVFVPDWGNKKAAHPGP